MAWKKACLNQTVKWIVAHIATKQAQQVAVTIPAGYCQELRVDAEKFLQQRTATLQAMRRFASKAGWAAGIATVFWSFVAPFWAACAGAEKEHKTRIGSSEGATVAIARVCMEFEWMVALFTVRIEALTKLYYPGRS